TASFSTGFRNDNYYNSTLGLQDATAWTAGVDLTRAPAHRTSLTAGYNHESILQRQRSRSRPVSNGFALDFPDFDWITTTTDTIETFHVGVPPAVAPETAD